MVRERIADDIYIFTSRLYAQVTAGAILTKEGVILIDTLFFPDETRAIRKFLEDRLKLPVRYLINTHYHADHTQGSYLFPEARIISHSLCRQLLDTKGREGLNQAQENIPELEDAFIVLPDLVFSDGTLSLTVGGKTLQLHYMPGHSQDIIGVFVENNQILFASDNLMPVPTFFDGSYDDLVHSLHQILEMTPESIVQGHGEVILRGEVDTIVRSNLTYLEVIQEHVQDILGKGKPVTALQEIDIESCGKSRIPLNGLVTDLHFANLHRLYETLSQS